MTRFIAFSGCNSSLNDLPSQVLQVAAKITKEKSIQPQKALKGKMPFCAGLVRAGAYTHCHGNQFYTAAK